MLYFILSILIIIQLFTLLKVISFREKEKKSEDLIEKYKDVTLIAKIPKDVTYYDIEPNYDTFYNFMENIKLEDWKAEVSEERSVYKSTWDIKIKSHDGKSKMSVRLRDYDDGDGVFLSTCTITAGDASLSINKEDAIAKDVILFTWNYIIEYYDNKSKEYEAYWKENIDKINNQLKTFNRSKRLNDILK